MRRKLFWPVAVLILTVTFLVQHYSGGVSQTDRSEQSQGEALIGGDFTLTNQEGRTVRAGDFRGRIMLVFFGFTHCPDICPVTMASLTQAMEQLGGDAKKVAPVFITVDPQRDTPEVMKAYLDHFDPRIVGLTGTDKQVKDAASAYKAYFSKAAGGHEASHGEGSHGNHKSDNYMVDHSGFIYVMGTDGKYIRHFPYDAKPEEIVSAVKKLI